MLIILMATFGFRETLVAIIGDATLIVTALALAAIALRVRRKVGAP